MKIENSNLEFRKIKSLKFLYEINENGTIVRNVKSKKQSKIKLDMHHSDKGYYAVWIHLGGKKNPQIKHLMIHKLVAECWLGECPNGYEVDHIDRDSHNNDYRNLRYVTKSEQMKNRDYSKIAKKGSENLEKARNARKKSVILIKDDVQLLFSSYADCARFLGKKYNKNVDAMRDRLKRQRSCIYDYEVKYLRNAETKHVRSKEQEIVHESDLTGDYLTAFNKGKVDEVEHRVVHLDNHEINS
jgi:hypothetical protein